MDGLGGSDRSGKANNEINENIIGLNRANNNTNIEPSTGGVKDIELIADGTKDT